MVETWEGAPAQSQEVAWCCKERWPGLSGSAVEGGPRYPLISIVSLLVLSITVVMSGLRVTFRDSCPLGQGCTLRAPEATSCPTLVGWHGRLARMPLGPSWDSGNPGLCTRQLQLQASDWALLLVRGAGQMTGPLSSAAGDCVPSRSAATAGPAA